MEARILEQNFINLGIKVGEEYMKNIPQIEELENPFSYSPLFIDFFKQINNTFLSLLEASHQENYFFYGASYQVFIQKIELVKKENINEVKGKTEGFIYKELLKKVSNFEGIILSENKLWYKSLLKHQTRFKHQIIKGNEDKFKPYFFLNKSNKNIIERNYSEVYKYLRAKIEKHDSENLTKSKKHFKLNTPNPNIDLLFWNKECHDLFHYLYYSYVWEDKEPIQIIKNNTKLPHGTIKKLTNIYHYFNESLNASKYEFRGTRDKYKSFIEERFNIRLNGNFEKSGKFLTEIKIMKEITEVFEELK